MKRILLVSLAATSLAAVSLGLAQPNPAPAPPEVTPPESIDLIIEAPPAYTSQEVAQHHSQEIGLGSQQYKLAAGEKRAKLTNRFTAADLKQLSVRYNGLQCPVLWNISNSNAKSLSITGVTIKLRSTTNPQGQVKTECEQAKIIATQKSLQKNLQKSL